MIDYGISKLLHPGIYNLIEDYNFIRISGLLRGKHLVPMVYKGPFFQKVSSIYNDLSACYMSLNNLNLKRSPGLCKQWMNEYYK